jgi:acetyl-CoA C-acetyltransferase
VHKQVRDERRETGNAEIDFTLGPPPRWPDRQPGGVVVVKNVTVVGAYEHPTRHAPDKSDFQFYQECAAGALEDAGLTSKDLDGLCVAASSQYGGDLSDPAPNRIADYFNISPRFVDTTYVGGASAQFMFRRAAMAIEMGLANCILLVYCARPRSKRVPVGSGGLATRGISVLRPTQESFEEIYGMTTMGTFAMTIARHMKLYGTKEEHMAQVAVTIRNHARLNPEARYRDEITVDDVLESRMISKPLRLLDCCAITDGGGALVLASPEVAAGCKTDPVYLIGAGEALTRGDGGLGDWMDVGTRTAAPIAFQDAGITHKDVDTVQIYDATAFHPIQQMEDLGFCGIGEGGDFLDGGRRIALGGELPINTDGGGLSSNHAVTRGIFVMIEAVRQLRGNCGDRQVKDAKIAIASATGGGGPGGQGHRRSASVLVFSKDAA